MAQLQQTPSGPPCNPVMPPKECTDALAAEILAAYATVMQTHKISAKTALRFLSEIDSIDDIEKHHNPIAEALFEALTVVLKKYPERVAIHGEAVTQVLLSLRRKRDADDVDGLTDTVKRTFSYWFHSIIPTHDRP